MSKPRSARKKGHEEEHANHERWLVSYADMLTVLVGLFIVLYAMSQVDQAKFEQLAASLSVSLAVQEAPFSLTGPPSSTPTQRSPPPAWNHQMNSSPQPCATTTPGLTRTQDKQETQKKKPSTPRTWQQLKLSTRTCNHWLTGSTLP